MFDSSFESGNKLYTKAMSAVNGEKISLCSQQLPFVEKGE